LAVAIAWNVPLAAIMVALIRGLISERTMERAMALWSLSIPLSCLGLIFLPTLRRLVFLPNVDVATLRSKLWALTVLWLAIFALWAAFDITRG
jgi:hypothetical protein